MNVDELIEWLKSAKRQSITDISKFKILVPTNSAVFDTLEGCVVDIVEKVVKLYD